MGSQLLVLIGKGDFSEEVEWFLTDQFEGLFDGEIMDLVKIGVLMVEVQFLDDLRLLFLRGGGWLFECGDNISV